MSNSSNLFQIFYTTVFVFLSFVLLILTLLSPADIIYQSHSNNRLGNIFAIAGVYIFTLLLAVLIYVSRIFTNRSVLAGIPKPWIPVEKPDVGKSVRRLVVEGLARSAIVAQQARPRDRSGEDNSMLDPTLTIPKESVPPWGTVSHRGWTAPDCSDLPNQEFRPVIDELPNLIEAKAVSLAPSDPRLAMHHFDPSPPNSQNSNVPDERIVEILQRPRNMCLRDYLNHLGHLNLIYPPRLTQEFIQFYERSRFSAHPLAEPEFRTTMGLFAEILRSMKFLDPEIIEEVQMDGSYGSGGSISEQSGISRTDTATSNSDESFVSGIDQRRPSRGRYHPSSSSSSSKGSFRLGSGDDGQSFRSFIRSSRTPSTRSLRPMASSSSDVSRQSVIRRTVSHV